MNKLTMKATKRILCLLLCLLCLLAAVPLSAIAEVEESLTHIDTCVEGCTGEDCTCTCHAAAEPAAHIDTCVEGCTGENCACTCHAAAEPAAHIDTCVEGCTGEDCTCTCHAATVSEQDNKEQDEQGEQSALFGALLSCTTCEEMDTILDNAELADVEALTKDELTALIEHVQNMDDDATAKEDLISELTILKDGDATTIPGRPGEGGGQGPDGNLGNYLSMANYSPDTQVYWQVAKDSTANDGRGEKDSDQTKVTSVTLNSINVTHTDSTTGGSNGTKLSSYYPELKKNGTNTDATIKVTPAEGYYVTKIVVACLGTRDWYGCNTWKAGNARVKTFESDNLGTITDTINSQSFGHTSESKNYCILIYVAPVPTPLRVEYDYGNITSILGDDFDSSVFATASGWTDASSSNVYKPSGDTVNDDPDGDAGIKTANTQMKYAYGSNRTTDDQKVTAIKTWKHTTNTVTEAAKAAAAAKGYYFAGWQYNYYNKVEATANASGSYNNYTYDFSDPAGSGTIGENSANLRLTTNCKLIAVWKPIELNVTKKVEGLVEGFIGVHTYTIQVQKKDSDGEWQKYGQNDLTFTINGNDEETQHVSPIIPGTYRVVETGGNTDLTNDDGGKMYITVTDKGEVTYNGSTDTQTLTVTNSYTSTPPTAKLTIKKTVSGNMYSEDKNFSFTVTYGDETKQFTLKGDPDNGNTYTIEGVPVGASVTVTENPDKYTFSVVTGEGGTTVTNYTAVTNGISFTMPSSDTTVVFNNENNANIDTGVILDALPYVLILAIVAGGVVLMLLRRRRSYED